MGWTSSPAWPTKAALVKHLSDPFRGGPNMKMLAHKSTGKGFFAVWERFDPETNQIDRALETTLTEKQMVSGRTEWAYKSMSEDAGPYGLDDCPLSFLELVGPAKNEFAEQFRERVRAYHKKRTQVLAVGQVYTATNTREIATFKLLNLKPLTGLGDNGVVYRLSRKFIGELVSPAS
jgi:hypothetical protein